MSTVLIIVVTLRYTRLVGEYIDSFSLVCTVLCIAQYTLEQLAALSLLKIKLSNLSSHASRCGMCCSGVSYLQYHGKVHFGDYKRRGYS